MSEKQFVLYEHKGDYYILKNPRLHLDFIEMLGDALTSEEIVEELNQLNDKVVELAEKNGQLKNYFKKRAECSNFQINKLKEEIEEKGDNWNNKVFDMERRCFNQIVEIRKFNRKTPYFDLKENWALLKSQKFEAVLENIKEWVMKTDERYDGKTWTESFETRDAKKVRLIKERREARNERARQRILRRG